MRYALELFCGTAGATSAFRRPGWRVVTVDLAAAVRPSVVADVRALPLAGRPAPDLLWMSPPCTEFSDARVPRCEWPSLELVFACFEAVRYFQPRFWVLENVRGAIRYLGSPLQKIGPWCLWGYFPLIKVTAELGLYRKAGLHTAVARAAVPPALSAAVYQAVEAHWGLSLLDLRPWRRHRHLKNRRECAEDKPIGASGIDPDGSGGTVLPLL